MDGGVKLTAWLCLMLLHAFVAGAGMDYFDGILFLIHICRDLCLNDQMTFVV
jgi:hypothetical protein